MDKTGQTGAYEPRLGVQLIKCLGRSILFRGNQEPERTLKAWLLGKTGPFFGRSPSGLPQSELEPNEGHLCPAAPQPLERHAIVKSPLGKAVDVPNLEPRKLKMSQRKASARSGGCVPWKLFKRRQRAGRADEQTVEVVESSGAPEPQQPAQEARNTLGCATEERRREDMATRKDKRYFTIATSVV